MQTQKAYLLDMCYSCKMEKENMENICLLSVTYYLPPSFNFKFLKGKGYALKILHFLWVQNYSLHNTQ